jgi:hypothetical protein
MNKKLLFCTLVLLLSVVSCGQLTTLEAQVSKVPDIVLTPFISENYGIRGVAPDGWSRVEIGIFGRGEWPKDLARLYIELYPGMSAEWVANVFILPQLAMDALPESDSKQESSALTWELYHVEAEIPEIGTLIVDIAFAEAEVGTYMVAVTSGKDDSDVLYDEVFLPALEALEPIEYKHRDRASVGELMTTEYTGDSPINNVYFSPMGESAPALHNLEGTLSVSEFKMQSNPPSNAPDGWSYFPGFSVGFFTYNDNLVPASREIIPPLSEKSYWRIILSPGKVWSEQGDNGLSRASFPFVLTGDNNNEAHNGIATFLYDEDQVSSFRFQIVQETAAWNVTDFWGQSTMEYLPGALDDQDALVSQFAEELSLQITIRPWNDLAEISDLRLLNTFTGSVHPLYISASGLIMNDTIYLQPCYTRYGEFPYCRYMRHGSFSVAKSMGAAVAMLRLAEMYGEEVFDLKIVDYVTVTVDHDGWDGVTFGDTLNMATGIGDDLPEIKDPNSIMVDEEGDEPRFNNFIDAKSAQEKAEVCFTSGNYPWGPGEVARYNSCNTFILSMAMDAYLKSKEGPEADVWDLVLEEVFRPIGVYHAPIMRTVESDGGRGIPQLWVGLYPTVDEVAKISKLLINHGVYQGQQILHAERLMEALRQTDVVGLRTGEFNDYGEGRYHMSFWSMPFLSADGHLFQVPFMSGFGGNRVIFNPNGIVCFRFTDAHEYNALPLIKVADAILPFQSP